MNLMWFMSISLQLGQSEKTRGDQGQQRAVIVPVLLVDFLAAAVQECGAVGMCI